MLLVALSPGNPYEYYNLLRLICCSAYSYLAFQALKQENERWVWILGTTAVLYNPIIPIHLTRGIWSVINIVTIVITIVSISVLKIETKKR